LGFGDRYLELVLKELELAEKEKAALDDLCAAGKISQSTYQHIYKRLAETAINLELRMKSLSERMTVRAKELENQMVSLKTFLANLETCHGAGEVDKEKYVNQSRALMLGLNAAEKELETVRGSLSIIHSTAMEKMPEATIRETLKEEEKPSEALINEVFSYLEKLENPRLPQISKDLNLPVTTVTKILLELERRGKVELLR